MFMKELLVLCDLLVVWMMVFFVVCIWGRKDSCHLSVSVVKDPVFKEHGRFFLVLSGLCLSELSVACLFNVD